MTSIEQVRSRLLGRRRDDFREPSRWGWRGWIGPAIFMVIGGIMRLWHLGVPHKLVFDETYYVKQGWSMVMYWFEMANDPLLQELKVVDQHFTANDPMIFGTEGDFVVHPPVGKWLIGWGEVPFGILNSYGWRFAAALAGTISIFMIGMIARRLFRSDLLGTVAAALLAFEGHHFVHSRTGLLDIFVMFFGLASFGALLIDRDKAREVLARKMVAGGSAVKELGPWLGARPWRWVLGIMIGLTAGVKWSGFYFMAIFGLCTVFWDLGARRAAGVRRWFAGTVLKDAPYAFLQVVIGGLVTYVATWTGWILTKGGSFRTWAETRRGQGFDWLPDWWRSLWAYHQQMLTSSAGINNEHPYRTDPWSWLIQGRPTSFFYEGSTPAANPNCTVAQCSQAISSIGTVTIWWGALLSLGVLLFMWLLRRDWRAGAILAGFVGGYFAWFFLSGRTVYSFYAVAFEPFAVLACVYVLGLLIGGRDATIARRRTGLAITGAFVLLTVLLFWFFHPIYVADVIPLEEWQRRMWFPSWV